MNSISQTLRALMLTAFAALTTTTLSAQSDIADAPRWQHEARIGFHLGGATPIPMPQEIREIKSFRPTMAIPLEYVLTRWSDSNPHWGLSTGLKIGNEGMITKARTKNYHTEVTGDEGERVAGYWTGDVETKATATRLTLPVMLAYRPNRNWTFRAGVYASLFLEKEFSGKVYDGYLRELTPLGQKTVFADGRYSNYDFSSSVRNFHYGARLGASLRVYKKWHVFTDLSFDLNELFEGDFHTVSFDLRPIYLYTGVSYAF